MAITTADFLNADKIVINSSGGKDSLAMLIRIVRQAKALGIPMDRLVVLHCDLGRVEWEGTREVAQAQAEYFGLRFEVRRRAGGDLLDQIKARYIKLKAKAEREGLDKVAPAWPSSAARYCTSDNKRDVAAKFITEIVRELALDRPARILNCMGLRAEESPARARRSDLELDKRLTNGKREVWAWLPIQDLTTAEVWEEIDASGAPSHPAYAAGMPRLSCRFCVLASRSALVLSAQLNPELAQEYVALEAEMGSSFRKDLSMADIVREAQSSPVPAAVADWAA